MKHNLWNILCLWFNIISILDQTKLRNKMTSPLNAQFFSLLDINWENYKLKQKSIREGELCIFQRKIKTLCLFISRGLLCISSYKHACMNDWLFINCTFILNRVNASPTDNYLMQPYVYDLMKKLRFHQKTNWQDQREIT